MTAVLLTVAEVAAQWRVSAQTVRNEINNRRLPALRIGSALRISSDDLAAYAASNRTGDQLAPRRTRRAS